MQPDSSDHWHFASWSSEVKSSADTAGMMLLLHGVFSSVWSVLIWHAVWYSMFYGVISVSSIRHDTETFWGRTGGQSYSSVTPHRKTTQFLFHLASNVQKLCYPLAAIGIYPLHCAVKINCRPQRYFRSIINHDKPEACHWNIHYSIHCSIL